MRMAQKIGMVLSLTGALAAIAAAAGAAGEGGGLTLFDGPRGRWLAEVRPDASLEVLEERDGWRHVRIDGWVPSGRAGTAEAAAPAAAPKPPAADMPPGAGTGTAASAALPAAAPAGAGAEPATLTGVLVALPGMVPATPGANLVVVLVAEPPRFDADYEVVAGDCRSKVEAQDARIAATQEHANKALNSTNNFAEASRRYDRAKAEVAAAKKERTAVLAACLDEIDTLVERHAASRAPTDSIGRFEFKGVKPGAYRVIGRDRREDSVRAWAYDALVNGPGLVTLDPTAPVPDPYRGLR
jgi:hypothetical protein